ncbi:LSU ribosomal protein L29p (L35e) [uncultured Synechococcales cyanobacterium]|uniref:Large ribosomal subunit protein uL29 n=1 Tax=uncultured Synechococcales cyanobacterium TaxID=1936017 RepID=A0A6J4VP72_9CYAN|nr:LSU ribosomal protein L29p (L35e) [uncultured Synechococcales cyanobacterium]
MALSKIQDFRDLSDEEIDTQIQTLKRQLFELRMQKATRQTVQPHLFKHARHQLAQLMTLERERQISVVNADEPTVTPTGDVISGS